MWLDVKFKSLPVYLYRCNVAVMFEDERLQSVGLKGKIKHISKQLHIFN